MSNLVGPVFMLGFAAAVGWLLRKAGTPNRQQQHAADLRLLASELGATVRTDNQSTSQLRVDKSGVTHLVAYRMSSGRNIVDGRSGPLRGTRGCMLHIVRKDALARALTRTSANRESSKSKFGAEWSVTSDCEDAAEQFLTAAVRQLLMDSLVVDVKIEHSFVNSECAPSPEDILKGARGVLALQQRLADEAMAADQHFASSAAAIGAQVLFPFAFLPRTHPEHSALVGRFGSVELTVHVHVVSGRLHTTFQYVAPHGLTTFRVERFQPEHIARHRDVADERVLGVDVLPHGRHVLGANNMQSARAFIAKHVRPGYEVYGRQLCTIEVTPTGFEATYERLALEPETCERIGAVFADWLRPDALQPYR
jgi:hypothetical protein